MKKFAGLACFLLFYHSSYSQCPISDFTVQSPACAGVPIQLSNTGSGGSTYLWNFCSYADFDSSSITDLGNFSPLLNGIFGVTLVSDDTNYYAFAKNSADVMVRFDFGNSLNNTPVAVSLGNLIPGLDRSNLSFLKRNNTWHAFFCTYDGSLYRLDFGGSLTNTPTVTLLSSVSINGGIYCTDIAVDSGEVVLFVGSYDNKNVTVVNFGSNIQNTSPATHVLATSFFPGLLAVVDVDLAKECNTWYALVTDYFGKVYKLDFGTSLSNPTPVSQTVATLGFTNRRAFITRNRNSWVYFVFNTGTEVRVLNFGSSLTNNSPQIIPGSAVSLTGYGSIEANDFLNCQGKIYGISVPYSSPSMQRFRYENDCHASVSESAAFEPQNLSYDEGGKYYIELQSTDTAGNTSFAYDSITVRATPSSDFSFSNTCENQSTLFNNLSTIIGDTIVSWKWHFGDGDSALTSNASHIYLNTGNYPVKLVSIATSGCADTLVQNVHIAALPDAYFRQATGCSDQSLLFTDSSTIAIGTIVGWQWDFGDGTGTSINQNPYYAFADGGVFSVSLTVSSDSGCSDLFSRPIQVNSSPDGAFEVSNTCVGQPVQFVNQSVSDTAITSYLWDFGDLITDTAQNPFHSYLAAVASYPVSLIAYSANGCNDTVNQVIKINNIPSVSFSYSPTNACEGNAVAFTDLSTVTGDTVSKWLWNFGDGFTDSIANPVHTFDAFGPYSVSLIAYAATSCGSSSTQNISVIEGPTAQFSYTAVCLGSTTAFDDLTIIPVGSSITRYHWDFGDGDTSDLQDPMHDFVTPGTHIVVLSVETNFGCTDQDTLAVTVHPPPVASFNYSNPCSHYPIDFASTSTVPVPYTISTYRWSFGDPASGTNDTSSMATPSHSYDTTNSYAITLIVTSDAGCADTTFQVLTIQQSSIVNFQYSPTCLGDYTDFANLTTPPSLDTAWFWKFGDGQFSLLREPAHYYVNPGPYLVTLTATSSNGCVSEATKTVMVSPIPVADFLNTPICIGTPYQFQDNSSISQGSALASWHWVVVGIDSSNVQNPVFTFPDTGNYIVTLQVTSSDSCKKSVSKTVRVHPLPVANFVFNPQYGNPPLVVNFTNLTTGGSSYQWSFGDGGQSTAVNPSNIYQDTGKFFIELISQSAAGCFDTVEKSIYVIKPLLDLALRNIYSYVQDHHLYLSAEVINLGTRDVNTFNISADVDNGNSIRETYTGFLPNGSQGIRLYNFNASFELTEGMDIRYYCIRVSDPNGEQDNVPSNDEKCSSLESSFSLKDPYPNPFISELTLEMILPYSDVLTLEIFDQTGKKVRELYNSTAPKGLTTVKADLQGLASGVYTLKCTFRDDVIVRPILKSNIPK